MEETYKEIPIELAREIALQVYGDLILTRADTPSLRVEGDPELVEKAHARPRGDVLELTLGRDWMDRFASGLKILGNRPLRYRLALPDPTRIEVNGRGRLQIDALAGERLAVRINGLADGALRGLDLRELDVELSGRGELELAGRATRQRLRISGSGRIEALALDSDAADVRISGHGDVKLTARSTLDVDLAGFGNVVYAGEPQVRQRVSGGGGVRRWQDSADDARREPPEEPPPRA